MAAKLTRLTHKIAIQLHLVVESCTIFSSRSRWPVRKLLDTPSYVYHIEFLEIGQIFRALLHADGRADRQTWNNLVIFYTFA
jgi:hypothetical protein